MTTMSSYTQFGYPYGASQVKNQINFTVVRDWSRLSRLALIIIKSNHSIRLSQVVTSCLIGLSIVGGDGEMRGEGDGWMDGWMETGNRKVLSKLI